MRLPKLNSELDQLIQAGVQRSVIEPVESAGQELNELIRENGDKADVSDPKI